MNAQTFLQLIELVVITIGVIGGLVQLRSMRNARARESALALLQSFISPSYVKGMHLLFDLPDDLSHDEIKSRVGAGVHDIFNVAATHESIGVLVRRGELDLEMVEDFYSGPILLYRQKFGRAMDDIRAFTGRPTIGEWGEWLADRIRAKEAERPAVSAAIEHADWTPDPVKKAALKK